MFVIKHNFEINTSTPIIYKAITTLDGLNGWWTTNTTGCPKKGEKIRFNFEQNMFDVMEVIEEEENKLVIWKCIESSFPLGKEWINTQISFTLFESKSNKTLVKFEHKGWKAVTDFYGICNYHWGLFMHSLKILCETGKGNPQVIIKVESSD